MKDYAEVYLEAIKMLIWLKSLCYDLCFLLPEVIEGNIQMLHRLIHPQTISNSLCAIAISIISKLVEAIIKNFEGLIGCE